MEIEYVHVKWPNGDDEMVPASTAHIRAEAGDFTIVDDKPKPWRQFKPRLPLGTPNSGRRVIEPAAAPDSQPVTEPDDGQETTPITEPAPDGADQPEEANA